MTERARWEYVVVAMRGLSGDRSKVEDELNERGREGWELVAITPDTDLCYPMLVFKRAAQPA